MSKVKTYRKRPIEVKAVQITADAVDEIVEWGDGMIEVISNDDDECCLKITTDTGEHFADGGDFIVKGIDGNFYAVPYRTFLELYEGVDSNSNTDSDCTITW